MTKVRKGRRIVATIMAVALSAATITTNMVPVAEVAVQAAEDVTYTKLADSSVEGFYYRKDQYGYVQCTTDKTYVYTSYDQAVKDIGSMAKRIYLEDKCNKFSLSIPIEIKTGERVEKIDNGQIEKDVQKIISADTGKAEEGYTLISMQRCGGNVLAENKSDGIDKSYTDGIYKGYYSGTGGYRTMSDRYHQTVEKLGSVIKSLNLDGKSDYDKFKAITNWIVSNVKYDNYYAVKDNSSMTPGTKYPHDMTGAALDGYAVCDGYAGLFYYMANAVELNALYEDGIANDNRDGHAWNLVQIDGTYYYVDPTNASFKKDGEPGTEVLHGSKYFFSLYTPDSTTIEDTYKNITKDDYSKEHSVCQGKHKLGTAEKSKGATCTLEGWTSHKCTVAGCNYEEYEWIEPLGHIWSDKGTVIQEQSCDKPEITRYKCVRTDIWPECKATKDRVTKESLGGHSWNNGEVTTKPTCTEEGVKTYTCTRCDETKTETIAKIQHDFEEHVVTPATCKSQGVSYKVCKKCGLTTQRRPSPKKDHTPELRKKKEATCKSEGYTGDTYCSVCGKLLQSGQKIAKKEHTPGEWEIIQPTCKKYGLKRRDCTVCGESLDLEVLEKLDHTWDNGVITKEATETEEGVKTYTCKTCGETKTHSIPVISHHWNQGTVTKEATCTENGELTHHCADADCGKTWVETIPATGHQHAEIRDEKKASCTEEGYGGDTYCTDCGKLIKKGSITEKSDHNWQLTSEEKATCEKDGSKTYTCEDCEETKIETILAVGHKFSSWKTIKAQNIYSGAVQERICSACGKKETRIIGNKLKPVLKVNAPKLQLKRGQKTQKFILTDMAKGDFVKSWVSSNKKIVTISGKPNGTCIIRAGKKTGSAKITITLNSKLKKTIGVKVQKKAVACTSIKNVPKKLNLKRKKSYQLKPMIDPITCTDKVKYKTSNKKVIKVTSKGKITAVKKGKGKIIVMVGEKKFVCTIIVR